MMLDFSYKRILAISTPIMLGSAVQNVIALSDSVFLYHLSETDFAAIGFVGVFYLVIAAIGYGFSKGGQIMIARRAGENQPKEIGRTFQAMFFFEMALSLLLFLFMEYVAHWLFSSFLHSEILINKSLEYLHFRSWGVFFSYAGLAIISLYTGIGMTRFIVVDTIILALVNIVLNYGLIFGKWGLPEMGIGGAGLASTIAEVVAFVIFVVYMLKDKKMVPLKIFCVRRISATLIRQQLLLAGPIVAQAVVGIGSWFVFFGFVEKLGERPLAITNLARMIYLVLSIPCWGFSSGINTIVSNIIGQQRHENVLPAIYRTATLSFLFTIILSIPFLFFPVPTLYPLLGGDDLSLITQSKPIFLVLFGILSVFSISSIFFNGLAGTGATYYGLKMQFFSAITYLVYTYVIINYTNGGLPFAWAAELFYWLIILVFSYLFMQSDKWHKMSV